MMTSLVLMFTQRWTRANMAMFMRMLWISSGVS